MYRESWQRLTKLYDEDEAKAIVRLVLEERFGMSWTDILLAEDNILLAEKEQRLALESIMQRLEQSEPVQYVLGQTTFGQRRFHVEPGVLIPRPETYELCQLALREIGEGKKNVFPHILDIGTGSGCIACTLSAEMPEAQVVAWDISDTALRIAGENVKQLGVSVKLEKRDILKEAETGKRKKENEEHTCWDVIVSNPPYVCEQEKAGMERHVSEHEPAEALFVPDDDPLLFYRSIGRYALKTLKPEGCLLVEINSRFGEETSNLFAEMGFVGVQLHTDLFDKDRFVVAYRT